MADLSGILTPVGEKRRGTELALVGFAAVLTLVLYFILWIPGLIANILFYREAREVKRVTGRAPAGMGCLSAMIWGSIIPFILLIIVIAANS